MQPSGFTVWVVDVQDWHGGPYVKGIYAEQERAVKEGVPAAFKEDMEYHGGNGKFKRVKSRIFPPDGTIYFEGNGTTVTVTRHQIV